MGNVRLYVPNGTAWDNTMASSARASANNVNIVSSITHILHYTMQVIKYVDG